MILKLPMGQKFTDLSFTIVVVFDKYFRVAILKPEIDNALYSDCFNLVVY